jgi:hypothetical protein
MSLCEGVDPSNSVAVVEFGYLGELRMRYVDWTDPFLLRMMRCMKEFLSSCECSW